MASVRKRVRVEATARRPGVQDDWVPRHSPWVPAGETYLGCSGPDAIKPKRDGRVVVGALTPCLGCGGAEQTLRMLVQYTDHSRIEWAGVWLDNPWSIDPVLADAVRAICPVVTGWNACQRLLDVCDLAYTWGIRKSGKLFEGRKALRVLCSHGSDPFFTRSALEDAATAHVLVAVADSAIAPYPESERSRVTVIWNAAEAERVRAKATREEMRNSWGVTDGMFVFGAHTRFSKEKEVHRMVAALPHVPDHFRLVLAGWGMQEGDLKSLAVRLGQAHKLIMPGVTRDVGGFLIGLDRYISTSPSEGCSLALNEALVAGTPAVSTQTGLLKSHPELARIIPKHPDGKQVARALVDDAQHDEEARARAARARAYALEHLTEESYGRKWTDLLVKAAAE